jgi:hypothetical protein
MKIVLTTTFLVTFVAMDIVGINYAFGQGNVTGIMENDKRMNINTTLPTTIISNATLAFAQDGSIAPEEVNNTMQIFNDTSMTMMNATLPVSLTGNNTAKPMD